jgi:dipeptidyl aminopeptidase/acylaminoacyl peptidase
MSRPAKFLSALLCCALAAPAISVVSVAQSAGHSPEDRASRAKLHAITLDDLDRLKDVDDPRVSPDGNWVAYTVEGVDKESDSGIADLWMVSWDGSEDIRLTWNYDASVAEPRWSPDGRYLSFLSDREGAPKVEGAQVWTLDRRGGEAHQLTAIEDKLDAYEWSPDGKKLLLTITEIPEPKKDKDKDKVKDKKTKNASEEDSDDDDPDKPKPIVIDRYHFKQDVEGYLSTDSRPSLLYLYDIATKKLEKLTTDKRFDEGEAAWSPDGAQIVFVSNHDADPDRTNNTDVFVVAAKPNSKPRQLSATPGNDGGHPAWSPDGKLIAYIHGSEPKFDEYNRRQLAVVPAAGGEPRILTANFDRSVAAPAWSPDGQSIAVLVDDDRSLYPASVSLGDGSVTRLIDSPGMADKADRQGSRFALTWSTDAAPLEVFALEAGPKGGQTLRKLSRQNDALIASLKLAPTRDLQATSPDGTDVHGLLTLPLGYAPGKTYPMLLRIHGGPDWQDYHDFEPERQIFAAHGYAVLNVNYRGSSGRDTAYQQAIFRDWGDKEVVDLLACVDEAVKEGVADPDRLGVGGWSYGGILTDYTIATTTRFKAAISGAGMGNPISFYGIDEYILQYEQELGAPWKDPDIYAKLGYPFLHAGRIKTPTLFMGGDADFNVPIAGGEQMYQALRSLGVPTELVVYPGEFHEFSRPSFIRDRYQRYLDWYGKYLMPKAASAK